MGVPSLRRLILRLRLGGLSLGLSVAVMLSHGVSQAIATNLPSVAPPSVSLPAPFPAWEIPLRQALATLLRHQAPSQEQLRRAIELIVDLQQAALDAQLPEEHLPEAPVTGPTQAVTELDPSAAIVYPIVLPDRLAVIAAIPDQPLSYHAIDLPQSEVIATLRQFRQSLHPAYPNTLRLQVSQQIYDWLIRPIQPRLDRAQIKTLVFTLDTPLRDLPMAALYDGQHYLIERYGIALVPGLDLLPATPFANLNAIRLLAAGLSEARQGFPALPAVMTELAAITATLPAHTLVNAEFTETALVTTLQSWPATIVHIASHAQASSNPEATFILTWDDKIRALNFRKLLQTEIRESTIIELLVLSACQTAGGDQGAALGLGGLAMRSGVRSVVATLWSVNDQSTAALMARLYQELAQHRLTRGSALRQAQLSLLQSGLYQHPYYWAPFVLLGDWR